MVLHSSGNRFKQISAFENVLIEYLFFGHSPFLTQNFDNGEVSGGSGGGGGCAKLPLLSLLVPNRRDTYRNPQYPPSIAKRHFV